MDTRRTVALVALAWPLMLGVGDQLRLRASAEATDGDYGVQQVMADFAAINMHRGLYETASWIFFAAAVATIPAVILLWRLAVARSPRWAWAGAVLGAAAAAGQFVHLNYFAANQGFSSHDAPAVAAELYLASSETGFGAAIFVPYIVGMLLAPLVLAIALKRAGVIPVWALIAVVIGTAVFTVLGSSQGGSAVWSVLLAIGFLPVVRAARSERSAEPEAVAEPAGA